MVTGMNENQEEARASRNMHFGITFKEALRLFQGGYYAAIITPENGGECTIIRPDGSLCSPRSVTDKERKLMRNILNV